MRNRVRRAHEPRCGPRPCTIRRAANSPLCRRSSCTCIWIAASVSTWCAGSIPTISFAAYRRDFIAPRKCRDLAEYLLSPPRQVALMQTEEQLRLVTLDLFAQLRRDNVVYAEMRFAPLLHTARDSRRGVSLPSWMMPWPRAWPRRASRRG